MKFVTYLNMEAEHIGLLSPCGKFVYPLNQWGYKGDMVSFIQHDNPDRRQALEKACDSNVVRSLALEDVTLLAPIPHPPHDILCVGLNYAKHVQESGGFFQRENAAAPKHPVFFSKRVNRCVPPQGGIALHGDITGKLDYEAELAVVIGRECSQVAPEDIWAYIFGYTIVNDISARDLQKDHVQYTFAKGLDDATPMGPCIVTLDEFETPPHLRIQSFVNGRPRQDGNTRDFIFDIPTMLSWLSMGITLYPGDVFITGTPDGVGMGMDPPCFLGEGDVVECRIEGIGSIRNLVR